MITNTIAILLVKQHKTEYIKNQTITESRAFEYARRAYEVAQTSPYKDENFPKPPRQEGISWRPVAPDGKKLDYWTAEWYGYTDQLNGTVNFYPDGKGHAVIFFDYSDWKRNVDKEEALEWSKKYYRALGGKFELSIRQYEDYVIGLNQHFYVFDLVVPGTNHRIAEGYRASIGATYGLPKGLLIPNDPDISKLKATPLPVQEIEYVLTHEMHQKFGFWQMVVNVDPSPIYYQSQDPSHFILTYEATVYDDLSLDEKGNPETYVISHVNAENGKITLLAPSWSRFGLSKPKPSKKKFSWGEKEWQIGKVSGKVKAVKGEPGSKVSHKMVLSSKINKALIVVDLEQNLIFTKVNNEWIAGKPTGKLAQALFKK